MRLRFAMCSARIQNPAGCLGRHPGLQTNASASPVAAKIVDVPAYCWECVDMGFAIGTFLGSYGTKNARSLYSQCMWTDSPLRWTSSWPYQVEFSADLDTLGWGSPGSRRWRRSQGLSERSSPKPRRRLFFRSEFDRRLRSTDSPWLLPKDTGT